MSKDTYKVVFSNHKTSAEFTISFPLSSYDYNELEEQAEAKGIDILNDKNICTLISGNYEPRFAAITSDSNALNNYYDYEGDYEQTIIYYSLLQNEPDLAKRFKSGHVTCYLESKKPTNNNYYFIGLDGKYVEVLS